MLKVNPDEITTLPELNEYIVQSYNEIWNQVYYFNKLKSKYSDPAKTICDEISSNLYKLLDLYRNPLFIKGNNDE